MTMKMAGMRHLEKVVTSKHRNAQFPSTRLVTDFGHVLDAVVDAVAPSVSHCPAKGD